MNPITKELVIIFLFSLAYFIFLIIMLARPQPITFLAGYILIYLFMFLVFNSKLKEVIKEGQGDLNVML